MCACEGPIIRRVARSAQSQVLFPHPRWVAPVTLTGDPPNPINPPPGCRFHTRCAHAEACCAAVEPLLSSDATVGGHYTACHMLVPGSGHSAAPRIAA